MPPPSIAAHASFITLFVMHVPAVPNFLGRIICIYKLHGRISLPRSLLRHVCSSTRSYTDFLCLVEVAVERTRGTSVPEQRKCCQAGLPIALDNKLKKKIVSVMNMLLIYLFASMKLEKGHKKITWL